MTKTNLLWPTSLGLATILGSFALACVFPFAAFAALAALTLGRKEGMALIAGTWLANQLVGFFLLSFPWDGQAVGHGISILVTTMIALFAARWASAKAGANPFARAAAALGSAFIVYEVLLWAYAQVGGGAENFTPAIIGDVALNDGLWFAGLMALRFAISRATGKQPLPQMA